MPFSMGNGQEEVEAEHLNSPRVLGSRNLSFRIF